jgi:hypothetical protein
MRLLRSIVRHQAQLKYAAEALIDVLLAPKVGRDLAEF